MPARVAARPARPERVGVAALLMRRPIRTRFGRTFSPLGGGVIAQLAWAVPLATLLWVAAAWAMGWLP